MRQLDLFNGVAGSTFYATMYTCDWGYELDVSSDPYYEEHADFAINVEPSFFGSLEQWKKDIAERAMRKLTELNLIRSVDGVAFLDREKFEEWCNV